MFNLEFVAIFKLFYGVLHRKVFGKFLYWSEIRNGALFANQATHSKQFCDNIVNNSHLSFSGMCVCACACVRVCMCVSSVL